MTRGEDRYSVAKHTKNCLCKKCIDAAMADIRAKRLAAEKPKTGPKALSFGPGSFVIDFGSLYGGVFKESAPKPKSDLTERVANQIAELTAGFEGQGKEELPKAPASDTYADAYNSAVKNCDHPASLLQEGLYGREWQCGQCGRWLNRADLHRKGYL